MSTALWNWIVRPILMIPALPAFLALGLIFLWLGNRSGGDVDPGFVAVRGRLGAGAAAGFPSRRPLMCPSETLASPRALS